MPARAQGPLRPRSTSNVGVATMAPAKPRVSQAIAHDARSAALAKRSQWEAALIEFERDHPTEAKALKKFLNSRNPTSSPSTVTSD